MNTNNPDASFRTRGLAWTPFIVLLIMASCSERSTEETDHDTAFPIAVATAVERDFSSKRTVTAPVVAYKRVYLTARTTGEVLEINAEEGNRIKKGTLLVRLDTRRQEAQLRKAMATLLEIKQNYQRSLHLFEQEMIPLAEFELAERQLEEAKAEVEFWEIETGFGHVRSPIDGVITARLIETGNTVSENQRLFTIENHDLLVARPGLPERDIVQLTERQRLDISFDVFPGNHYTGHVRRIFPAADAISRLFTVEVEIDQSELPGPIFPGFLTRVHFRTGPSDLLLAVPVESVYWKEDQAWVFMVEGGKVFQTSIKTGLQQEGWHEVLSGLQPGDTIAAGSLHALKDSTLVRVQGTFRRHGFSAQ